MSLLRPAGASVLLRRAVAQLEREGKIFDLPETKFYTGSGPVDLSVRFHGERAATGVGPAAGPHTQLAGNILLAYLAGARVLELKTVQILDRLEIPRPCIDMQTVGFNVEWSQELSLGESAREYVKARFLIEALRALGLPRRLAETGRACLFDVSVGYDLEGIRSAAIDRFLRAMLDPSDEVEAIRDELRAGLPSPLAPLAEIPVEGPVGDCVTLSTFHGCPPGEIEAIGRHLIETYGFHLVVKMNPTLLGYEEVTDLVRGRLGYDELRIPRSAFEHDPSFDEGLDLIRSLRRTGEKAGRMVGAKFTNTLLVENHKEFFREKEMYLSGRPLHVVSLLLAARVRERLGDDLPVSFSAGIDRRNYPDAVAAGLVPVTVCTDLLHPGGYGRLRAYHDALAARMRAAGASSIAGFILKSDDPSCDREEAPREEVFAASLRNHRRAAEEALDDRRYAAAANRTPPRKIGSRLGLFDCVNCDKCIGVCPNDANFAYEVEPRTIRYRDLVVRKGSLVPSGEEKIVAVGKGKRPRHQIANGPDRCNDCGNCDVFCPEEGGPYLEKPRIFTSRRSFERDGGPGFLFERRGGKLRVRARRGEREARVEIDGERAVYRIGGARLLFVGAAAMPGESRPGAGLAEGEVVPLAPYHRIRILAEGILAPGAVSFATLLLAPDA